MKITQVGLKLIQSQRSPTLKAVASFTIDDAFVVKDVKVIQRKDGSFFVAMPSTYVNGEFRDICHPVTPQARNLIETFVLDEFNKATESNAGKPKFGRKLLESKEPMKGPSLLGSNSGGAEANIASHGDDEGASDPGADIASHGASDESFSEASNELEVLAKEFVAGVSQAQEAEAVSGESAELGEALTTDKSSAKDNVLDPALLDGVMDNA